MKLSFVSTFTVCVAVLSGAASLALADGSAVSKVPANLVPAEQLDAAIQAQAQPAEQAAVSEEDFGPGRGGFGPRPGPFPRPEPRPLPYPVRYPVPGPYPYPVGVFVTCYAQSPANGLSYPGTAYGAANAQTAALTVCFQATGYECVPTGCY